MLKRETREMRVLVLLLVLLMGCLGQSEEYDISDISSVINNPGAYSDKEVSFNATVTQIIPLQPGVMLQLKDNTGEIPAIYTGEVLTVNVGYQAIFSGKLIKDTSFASAHGAGPGVLLSITAIRDVIPGVLKGTSPQVSPHQISKNPTIAEVRSNPMLYSQQETITITGKCVQTMNAGGYTYAELDDGSDKMWVALPESKVEVGQNYRAEGILMVNFPSRTLNKTFDVILFCAGLEAL
jgi:hypothetical protein